MGKYKTIRALETHPVATIGISIYVVHIALVSLAGYFEIHSLSFLSYIWPYSMAITLQGLGSFASSHESAIIFVTGGLILVSIWCFFVDKAAQRFRLDKTIVVLTSLFIWYVPLIAALFMAGIFAQIMGWPVGE
jgi:hypothetical protein